MKKMLFVFAVASLAMASCRKDRTCTCKDQSPNPSENEVYQLPNTTKRSANKACKDLDAAKSAFDNYKCTLD